LVLHDDDDYDDDDDDDDDADADDEIWWNNILNSKIAKNGTAHNTGLINKESL
jgi:hypothetical protein